MSPTDFCKIETALGLNTPAMAEALGIDVRRVRAFEAGTNEVPQVVELACWALVTQPRIAEATGLLHSIGGSE